jgi:putative endonuclease
VTHGARRRAERFGRLAEEACAWHLRLRGYRLLARRLRTPAGEIDILARRGRVVAVVEVKARGDLILAAEALGPHQRRRLARAAAFVAARPDCAGCDLRFDVMLFRRWRWPRHLIAAWTPDAAG